MQIDFTPLKKSRITQAEFGAFLKISRVTVSNWANGITGVHAMRAPRVTRLLRVIDKATLDGKLPINNKIPRPERLGAIKKVLVEYLRTAD